jgi:hypothetical protein
VSPSIRTTFPRHSIEIEGNVVGEVTWKSTAGQLDVGGATKMSTSRSIGNPGAYRDLAAGL